MDSFLIELRELCERHGIEYSLPLFCEEDINHITLPSTQTYPQLSPTSTCWSGQEKWIITTKKMRAVFYKKRRRKM